MNKTENDYYILQSARPVFMTDKKYYIHIISCAGRNNKKQAGAELCQAQSSAKLTATHKLVASK